ncbi:MAG: methyltransferase domain-containing protein [Pseudonocardiaceae bacterium]|nr:methyltransferase domain-containing protein [Pseudonocardiaceae bacterium]
MSNNDASGIYHRADVYEAFYRGRGKDYEGESTTVIKAIRERNDGASSLLDIACGTGSHLRYFAEEFDCTGLDISEEMLDLARKNVPSVPVQLGDMRRFKLGRSFDAITCMFSSISYLDSAEDLGRALKCFTRHLNDGGVIVVEPWWFPEKFIPGYVSGDVVTVDRRTISRVSYSIRDLSCSVRNSMASSMEVHYIVADANSGVQHFTDTHVMCLFARQEYENAFAEAGCSVEYLESDQPTPGLFVGVKAGTR